MDNKPTLQHTGRYQLRYRGTECANCQHPLDISDRYCPNCSQANSTKKLTLKDFFDEFFSSLISYDSKLLKTLSALLIRPGRITKDYVRGKRVSYTNPFRFLLSLAIVYFLMLNFTGDFQALDKFGADADGDWIREDGPLNFSAEFKDIPAEEQQTLETALDSLKIWENFMNSDSILLSDPPKHFKKTESDGFINRFFGKREFFNAVFNEDKIYQFDAIIKKYDLEDSRMNRSAFRAATSFNRFRKEPGSFVSSMISKLPFAVFFFLPAFAIFIWLAYIRKKYTYTDHLIFGFHITSLLFILLIVSFLVDSIFDTLSWWFFILVFGLYLFQAMRKFYEQGIFKTLVKYLFLNFVFFILAMLTIAILFTGGVFTY
ncbi:MAG: hypothetical protein Mars2KO_41120 [Maribacter sp.]